MQKPPPTISQQVITWHKQYGRKDLPWQIDVTPYRVWISEIMLQQTQVETVKAYYLRFMQSFPTLMGLAKAPQEHVLQHWTGLGYYARARNLHRCAQIIAQDYQGVFPSDLDSLMALPGIGRSTAGAILSLGLQQFAVILDGNVKRVLSRLHALDAWPGSTPMLKKLWALATTHTPQNQTAIYNQAMMDLGAMICTRSKPKCDICPIKANCLANQHNLQASLPVPKPKRSLPEREDFICVLFNEKTNSVLLEQRDAPGIWGGLWSFPLCPRPGPGLKRWLPQHSCYQQRLPISTHTFSHYRWHLTPALVHTQNSVVPQTCLQRPHVWYNIDHTTPLALAAPVKRLLKRLTQRATHES